MPGSGLNDAAMVAAAEALQGILLYAQIHTGPAGSTGQDHLSTAARAPITWGTITGAGDFNLADDLNFTGGELGGPVYSITLWSADRGGTAGDTGLGGTTSSTPLTWVDTIPADTTYAVVWISHFPSSSSPGTAVTIGGIAASPAPGSPFVYQTDGSYYTLEAFVLKDPPTGASKTVSVTKTSGGSGFNADAVYYQSVDSVGTMIPTNGDPTTHPTITVQHSSNAIVYSNAFTYRATGSNQDFTDYNQSQRYIATSGYFIQPLIIGDSYGNGGDLTFSATRTNTSYKWGGAILPLTASGGTFYGEFVLSGDNAFNNAGAYSVTSLSFDGSAS